MLLACAGRPAARVLRGRRLVADLQRLASVLPVAGPADPLLSAALRSSFDEPCNNDSAASARWLIPIG